MSPGFRVDAIRYWSGDQFASAVDGFAKRYKRDFELWLTTDPSQRPVEFGRILRAWQATRGRVMRRSRIERRHAPPYLDDLLAAVPSGALESLTLETLPTRTAAQDAALRQLWSTFENLTVDGAKPARAVGISKAAMLATDGRLGPGLDTNVRDAIRLAEPMTASAWIQVLQAIAEDIAAFTARNGAIAMCVARQYRHLHVGRLYDMALGPRETRIGTKKGQA